MQLQEHPEMERLAKKENFDLTDISWFATTWHCGHVGSEYNSTFSRRIYVKIEFSSQRGEMLLFLTTNVAAARHVQTTII